MMDKLIDIEVAEVETAGRNRAHRRAEAARNAAAAKPRKLPKSIWLITKVVAGVHIETQTPLYKISVERRDQRDTLAILSREGAAPVVGGLLERMSRPAGGEAAIWTDARATKESIGGGYTRLAVPTEWGFTVLKQLEDLESPRSFVNLNLGVPFINGGGS